MEAIYPLLSIYLNWAIFMLHEFGSLGLPEISLKLDGASKFVEISLRSFGKDD